MKKKSKEFRTGGEQVIGYKHKYWFGLDSQS